MIDALGLPERPRCGPSRSSSLVAFGLSLLVPPLGDRVEALGLAPRARAGRAPAATGFGSGLILGASLGLVYAPCAGPILAGVITVSAAQDFTAGKLAVALAYAIGSVAVLYLFMLGGRRLADRLSPPGPDPDRHGRRDGRGRGRDGADLDLRFQSAIADDLPAVLVNPTAEIEESGVVSDELADVRGGGRRGRGGGRGGGGARRALPDLGLGPELRRREVVQHGRRRGRSTGRAERRGQASC